MTTKYRLPAASGTGLKLQRFENEVFMDVDGKDIKDALEFCKNFPYQSGDILLCLFPKCGCHWMNNMLWKLKTITDYKRPLITMMEFQDKENIFQQEAPRIVQTHLRPTRLPKDHLENNGKVVFMMRNPKDACSSFFFHLKDAEAFKNGQTFSEFQESYFKGEMMWGSYLDYLKEWEDILYEKSKGNGYENVHVFYYEDFKKNPMDNLIRLNKCLGFERDQAYLDQVLEQTCFASMKQHGVENPEKVNNLCKNNEGQSVIYRKGEIGDWKNHFTVAQSEAVDELMKQKLTRGIVKFE